MKIKPTPDQIAHRAHQLWEERGGKHGSHQQDWLDAEKELTNKLDLEAAAVNKAVEPVKAVPPKDIHTVPPDPPVHNAHTDPPAKV